MKVYLVFMFMLLLLDSFLFGGGGGLGLRCSLGALGFSLFGFRAKVFRVFGVALNPKPQSLNPKPKALKHWFVMATWDLWEHQVARQHG